MLMTTEHSGILRSTWASDKALVNSYLIHENEVIYTADDSDFFVKVTEMLCSSVRECCGERHTDLRGPT